MIEDDVVKQDIWMMLFKFFGKVLGGIFIVIFGCEIQSGNLFVLLSLRFGELLVLCVVWLFNSLLNLGYVILFCYVVENYYFFVMLEFLVEYYSMEYLSLDDFNYEGFYKGSMYFDF